MKNKTKYNRKEEIGITGFNSISKLEAEIMKLVWGKDKITVRKVHEELLKKEIQEKDRDFISYTSVIAAMSGLVEKQLLKEDRSKKTYFYSAILDKNELSKSIIKSIADKLLTGSSKNMVHEFLDYSSNITFEGINKLLDEINKKQ
ncbi:MAG: BlaI/MecI/CopY family transcriptional regulator [Actinomycetota bacterium]|nr:BlaI/MecI/CopY family transcriptional regulator [Actinomycetota bacterium]